MALKSDAKYEEKLSLGFKNYMRNLVNFHPTPHKSKNFNVLFLSKVYEVSAKKMQTIYLS